MDFLKNSLTIEKIYSPPKKKYSNRNIDTKSIEYNVLEKLNNYTMRANVKPFKLNDYKENNNLLMNSVSENSNFKLNNVCYKEINNPLMKSISEIFNSKLIGVIYKKNEMDNYSIDEYDNLKNKKVIEITPDLIKGKSFSNTNVPSINENNYAQLRYLIKKIIFYYINFQKYNLIYQI